MDAERSIVFAALGGRAFESDVVITRADPALATPLPTTPLGHGVLGW